MQKITQLPSIGTVTMGDIMPIVDDFDVITKRTTLEGIYDIFKSLFDAIYEPIHADNARIGIIDYNDTATWVTPISVPGTGVFTALTNNGAWAFSNDTYKPVWIDDVWDVVENRFEWTQLKLWDSVGIRLDIELTTTISNTEIMVDIFLWEGGSTYQIPFILPVNFKNVVTARRLTVFNWIYMWDTNTINNTAKFKIAADKACTVKVNWWACQILPRP